MAATLVCGEEGAHQAPPADLRFPEFPKFTLTPQVSADVDADRAKLWSARKEQWTAAAEKESRPAEKARLLLAAANVILARELEPFCSQKILGLDSGETIESSRAYFEAAGQLIAGAREVLSAARPAETLPEDAVQPPVGDPGKGDLDSLVHLADALQSFLDGQRAFLLDGDESGTRRRAASALAPLLEDPDRKVAAAARLWQALLRGVEPDPAAALQILGSSTAAPASDTWPFGLFARVQRCRLLGVRGAWSSALVQLIQMEDQLESWVPDMADRGSARRLFSLVRLRILKQWQESLAPEQTAERAWCAQQAEEIVKSYFSVETTLLRLEPAIPEIVSIASPKAGEPGAEPR